MVSITEVKGVAPGTHPHAASDDPPLLPSKECALVSLSPSVSHGRLSAGAAPPRLSDAWVALAGLSAVFLVEMLDNSVLNVALPTIGRDLGSSTTGLQWVSGAYSVAFGGLMLLFGAVADRVGRRRVMLVGLVLLAVASLATAAVTTTEQLVAVRVLMGVAAAMTTPGSMALAFRLFDDAGLRVRALTVISTAGLVGLAVGPTFGGFVLAVAPWQVLLLADVPIALLALVGIRLGVAGDEPSGLRRDPVDVVGALLGTATVAGALVTPTVLVGAGGASSWGWLCLAVTAACAAGFVTRERTARHPLVDLHLLARPQVSSGLAFKAASGLAVAGLSYLVTLQLQFAWGWPPALAAVGTLPQVVVLLAGGRFVGPFVQRVGLGRAAWTSAAAVVTGLAVFGALSRHGYGWVLVALVLVAAGMRVVGVVAGASVLTGLPADRTSVGAALVDTASELASGVGVAAVGTIVAAFVAGSITTTAWTAPRLATFQDALTVAGLGLALVAALLVAVGMLRARSVDGRGGPGRADPAAPAPASVQLSTPTHSTTLTEETTRA
jgi:MFS family permease